MIEERFWKEEGKVGRFMEIFSLYELACVLLPCLVYGEIRAVRDKRAGKETSGVYLAWCLIFLVYLWMVLDVTGVGTVGDIIRNMPDVIVGGVNVVPFDSFGVGFVLNIVMFMPFGFLLPLIFKDCRRLKKTAGLAAVFSLMIELSQLLNFRATDVDDLMTNICGACAGYLVWRSFAKICGERIFAAQERRGEALRYILLAVAGVFFLYHPFLIINRMM